MQGVMLSIIFYYLAKILYFKTGIMFFISILACTNRKIIHRISGFFFECHKINENGEIV